MRSATRLGLAIGLLTTMMVAVQVAPSRAQSPIGMEPAKVDMTEMGGVEVVLRGADVAAKRLWFEIHGADSTSVSVTAPIRFGFDVEVMQLGLQESPSPLRVETLSAGQTATVFLSRDPFAMPQAWRVTVVMAFERLPSDGWVRVGEGAGREVVYRQRVPVAPVGSVPES